MRQATCGKFRCRCKYFVIAPQSLAEDRGQRSGKAEERSFQDRQAERERESEDARQSEQHSVGFAGGAHFRFQRSASRKPPTKVSLFAVLTPTCFASVQLGPVSALFVYNPAAASLPRKTGAGRTKRRFGCARIPGVRRCYASSRDKKRAQSPKLRKPSVLFPQCFTSLLERAAPPVAITRGKEWKMRADGAVTRKSEALRGFEKSLLNWKWEGRGKQWNCPRLQAAVVKDEEVRLRKNAEI